MTTFPDMAPHTARREIRWRRAGPLLALLAGLALSVAGCSWPAGSGPTNTGAARTGGPISTSAGPARTGGLGSKTGDGQSSGNQSAVGSYTADFAKCMQSHGVPSFPDPGGQGPFAPGSGVDPGSSAYQAALNGPCESLAPPAWVSSGPATRGGGGS